MTINDGCRADKRKARAEAEAAEALAETIRTAIASVCDYCLRPVATDEDWEQMQAGEGAHLCWDHPSCHGPRGDLPAFLAAHIEQARR